MAMFHAASLAIEFFLTCYVILPDRCTQFSNIYLTRSFIVHIYQVGYINSMNGIFRDLSKDLTIMISMLASDINIENYVYS